MTRKNFYKSAILFIDGIPYPVTEVEVTWPTIETVWGIRGPRQKIINGTFIAELSDEKVPS